jgi:hypothetical protein
MAETKETQDFVEIEKWAKKREGVPAIVKGTEDLARIKFDAMEDDLEEITWAELFEILNKHNLVMVYVDEDDSRFYKFIRKEDSQ